MADDNAATRPAIEFSEPLNRAFARILSRMKPELFILMSELIRDVATDTSYGTVKIILVEGHVEQIKAEKSYK